MAYVIRGIDPRPFEPWFAMSDAELAREGVQRMTVDRNPGFPCRVTLEDAEPGETVLLFNHEHLPVDTPYRSCHAIFIREWARQVGEFVGHIPPQLSTRLLSVRAFDAAGMMTDADVVEGTDLEPLIERLFAASSTEYLHVHNARRGCFAARVDRG